MDMELNENKTLAKGAMWNIIGNIALKLIAFVYMIIVARMFTQEDVGTFYLALSIISTITVFSDLGLSVAFGRYIPYYYGKGEHEKAYALLKTSYLFSGALSLIMMVLWFLLSWDIGAIFKNPQLIKIIQILSCYFVISTFYSLNTAFILSRKKAKEYNLVINLQNILKLILTLGLIITIGSTVETLTIGFIISYLIASLIAYWYVQKNIEKVEQNKTDLNEQIKIIKEVVPFGITISAVVTFWAIITYIDRIMLGYLLPQEKALTNIAIYTIASSLATLVAVFGSAINGIFFPIISEFYGKGMKKEMLKISATALKWTIIIATPFALVFIGFAGNILNMFYGEDYAGGATVLVIFTLGMYIRVLSNVQSSILAALRLIKIELYATASAAILNIILNLILIPIYGMEGAAIASVISLALMTILLTHYSKKMFGFGFPRGSHKPIIAGILSLALIFLMKGTVLSFVNDTFSDQVMNFGLEWPAFQKILKLLILGSLFTISCLFYFLLLLGLKSFGKDELEITASGLKKLKIPENYIKRIIGILEVEKR